MNRTLIWIRWLLLLLGLGLLAGAGFLASRTSAFVSSAANAEGIVVDLESSTSTDSDGRRSSAAHAVVEFSPAGAPARRLRSSVDSSPPAFDVGERVTVLYDPANPARARIRATFELWGGPIILGGIGGVFALIGGILLLVSHAGRRREAELRLHGRRVQARFQSVERNGALEVNGEHPYRIVCQWQDPATGLLHVFRSQNLWFDPTPHVRVEELTVFVDPKNPRRHLVDVSFLPKLAA